MKKVAQILGKVEDAEKFAKLYEERKVFFNRTYIDPQTAKTISSGANGPEKGKLVDIQGRWKNLSGLFADDGIYRYGMD